MAHVASACRHGRFTASVRRNGGIPPNRRLRITHVAAGYDDPCRLAPQTPPHGAAQAAVQLLTLHSTLCRSPSEKAVLFTNHHDTISFRASLSTMAHTLLCNSLASV